MLYPNDRFHVSALLVVLLLLASTGRASTWRLQAEGDVQDLRFGDIDGDGDLDAALTWSRLERNRLVRGISLYPRTPGGYDEFPLATSEIDADVFFVDFADVDRRGADSILLVGRDGLSRLSYSDGRFGEPEPIVECPSPFLAAQTDECSFVDIVKDIDRDGLEDLLLPGARGYEFFRARAEGGFEGPHRVAAAPVRGIGWGRNALFRITTRMARPSPTDWDGDGVGDLMLAFEDQLVRIDLRREGRPGAPEAVLDLATILDPGKAGEGGLARREGQLRDVDLDGRCDLILTQRAARPNLVSGVTTRTYLLMADDLAGEAPRPRQAIRTDGVTSPPRLFDLDVDGALDLIITTVPTDLLTRMRESVFDAASVTYYVYRFEKERGRFSPEPMFSTVLEVPADRLLDVGAYGWVTFRADYDGDGRPDLATYSDRRHELAVRRGVRERGLFSNRPIHFEEDAFAVLELDLPGPFSGLDLDGDGRAEIVSHGEDHAVVAEVGS